ncbi:hypothetical protein [Corallococcus silvisoli]|uniref:hypothetical protein n=1 Tax=Corallococcus silvisoli TaxID=2697031 RepID=UPI001377884D|nr:hypothetical protein [Corallococcus silvisoli]NBD12823.1 hypothetical protein [Corallococcus silvisoli]
MAKAMGGDMVLQLLHEFRELQEESRVQFARTDKSLKVVNTKVRVLFKRTQVLANQVRAFAVQLDEFRDNVGELTTHVSTLAKELDGVKRVQTKMFDQMGRMLHHLADAQAADRQRIVVLEQHVEGAGEH